jgi:hypothetical protein
MKIFILNDSLEIHNIATVIAKEWPTSTTEIRLFIEEAGGCFEGMSLRDFSETCWMGHSDAMHMGEFNADEFATKFNAEFVSRFPEESQKDHVNHLYLLGSETALQQGDSESFAEAIANKLFTNGFKKVIVHAIANPPGDNIRMNMEIITKPGIALGMHTYKSGDVHGFLFSQEQENILLDIDKSILELEVKLKEQSEYRSVEACALRNQLRAVQAERSKIMKKAVTFLETNELLEELNRPHNTFVPQHPELRPNKNLEQEKAIVEIEQHLRLMANLKHRNIQRLHHLKKLQVQLKNETGDWDRPICEALKKYNGFFSFLNKRTHTYRMLKGLHEVASKQENNTMKSMVAVEPLVKQKDRKKIHLRKKNKHPIPTPVMPEQMTEALKQLNEFASILENEYKSKKRWLGLFCPTTKEYKAKQLRILTQQIQYAFVENPIRPQWIVCVQAATLDDDLMQSFFTRRTKNLLINIIAGHAELGTHAPLPFVKRPVMSADNRSFAELR